MTDASTTVAVGSILADLKPVIDAVIGSVVVALIGFALALGNKYLGLKVSDADTKQLDDYFASLAQRAVAGAEGNLATAKIDVKSPLVASLVNEAIDHGPDVLAKFGLTQDVIAHRITAAIGGLQASMTRVAPAAAAPAK